MRIEKYVSDVHYPIVYPWWKAQTGRVLDPANISEDGALVYSEDGRPVCASWLYWGNSKLGHIGFTVANPDSRPREKIYAIELVIQYLLARAREVGMRYVASNSDSSALTKLFKKAGFATMDSHTSLSFVLEYPQHEDKEIF